MTENRKPYEGDERRESWLRSPEAMVSVICLIVTMAVAGVYWGGHADSQITQSKADIAELKAELENTRMSMQTRSDAVVDKMDAISNRLTALETSQTTLIGIMKDVNANLHRAGR